MSYTICDVIEKFILIEQSSMRFYNIMSENLKDSLPAVSLMATVLAREEAKHINYYKEIEHELEDKEGIEIDFFIYDKVSKLLFEFNHRMEAPSSNNVQALLRFAVEFERKNIGLILDIQGRLVESLQDTHKINYEILNRILAEEKSHEEKLKKLINV